MDTKRLPMHKRKYQWPSDISSLMSCLKHYLYFDSLQDLSKDNTPDLHDTLPGNKLLGGWLVLPSLQTNMQMSEDIVR